MYAIIETGGKQYRVTPGETIEVGRLEVAEGAPIQLDRVLLIGEGDKVTVGTPIVEGARVTATAGGEFKGEKLTVFKYKAKVRYRRKTGHRQLYTKLTIDKILGPGEAVPQPEKPKRTRKKAVESGT